jgi:hypothetical protein
MHFEQRLGGFFLVTQGNVLEIHWEHFGNVLGMHWERAENVLGTFWKYVANKLRMRWERGSTWVPTRSS